MLTSCGTCSDSGRRSSRDATGDHRAAAAAAGADRVRPHPPARPPALRRAAHHDPPLCCFASAPAAVGSRSPRPSAPPRRCAGRGDRDRARPDHDGGRPRPHEPVRRDRRARRLRQGARGGAARGPDRRRRPLGEGHDLDGRRRASSSAPTPRARIRATRSAARTRSGPGMRIGTASARRRAQLLALEPTLSIEPLRGNIDTRLRKRGERGLDAIVLAACGLDRLGLGARDRAPARSRRDAARGGPGCARAAGAGGRGGARRARRRRRDACAGRGRAALRRARSAAAASRPVAAHHDGAVADGADRGRGRRLDRAPLRDTTRRRSPPSSSSLRPMRIVVTRPEGQERGPRRAPRGRSATRSSTAR